MTRAEASAAGLKRYFTGKVCPKGHISERRVHNNGCVQCERESQIKRRASDGGKHRAYMAKYHSEKLDIRREYERKYRAVNLELVRARDRDYWRRNPDKKQAKRHRRRALEQNCEASLTSADIEQLRSERGKKCAVCGVKGKMTLDHIIPLSRGGSHVARNVQFLCFSCNAGKRNRPMEDFARTRGLLL